MRVTRVLFEELFYWKRYVNKTLNVSAPILVQRRLASNREGFITQQYFLSTKRVDALFNS